MSSANKLSHIDVNNANFYHTLQDEIDSDLARLKKSVVIVKKLRIQAAELEVETAALYHANLWHDIEQLKMSSRLINDFNENMNLNEIK